MFYVIYKMDAASLRCAKLIRFIKISRRRRLLFRLVAVVARVEHDDMIRTS